MTPDAAYSYPLKPGARRCKHTGCDVMIPDEHGPAVDRPTAPHGNGSYYVSPHVCPECDDNLCAEHCPAIRERAPLTAAKADGELEAANKHVEILQADAERQHAENVEIVTKAEAACAAKDEALREIEGALDTGSEADAMLREVALRALSPTSGAAYRARLAAAEERIRTQGVEWDEVHEALEDARATVALLTREAEGHAALVDEIRAKVAEYPYRGLAYVLSNLLAASRPEAPALPIVAASAEGESAAGVVEVPEKSQVEGE